MTGFSNRIRIGCIATGFSKQNKTKQNLFSWFFVFPVVGLPQPQYFILPISSQICDEIVMKIGVQIIPLAQIYWLISVFFLLVSFSVFFICQCFLYGKMFDLFFIW
jgi:hypothetical protein